MENKNCKFIIDNLEPIYVGINRKSTDLDDNTLLTSWIELDEYNIILPGE